MNSWTLCVCDQARVILHPDLEPQAGTMTIDDAGWIVNWEADVDKSRIETADVCIMDGWLVPGMVDLHVHGGGGGDVMGATSAELAKMTAFHARHGTTSMLATTVTAALADLEQVVAVVGQHQHQANQAKVMGVHLEGPFLNPSWSGAQDPASMIAPDLRWLERLQKTCPDQLRMMTLALEWPNALQLIAWLKQHGVVAAIGHSGVEASVVGKAVDAGLSHAVHTYNAMSGLHHRKPGILGAALVDDRISCELIADGIHVMPLAMEVLKRCKPSEQMVLVTDAISATGSSDGDYMLGDLAIQVREGIARLANQETLAGSTLTMDRAIQNVIAMLQIDLPEAIRWASTNPARILGMSAEIGGLHVGMRADMVWLNDQYAVQDVWINGNVIDRR